MIPNSIGKWLRQWHRILRRVPLVNSAERLAAHGRRYLNWRREFRKFARRAQAEAPELPTLWRDRMPCLEDCHEFTPFDRHYLYHTAWAARVVAANKPTLHVDIGSLLYFPALVSAFVPVLFLDYRKPALDLTNLKVGFGDLLSLPFPDKSLESLSCLHVLEHVGLGRYGDRLDPAADRKAMAELNRVVRPGGSLLIATPVGRPRVCFNAHRVYAPQTFRDAFPDMDLAGFALVPDDPGQGGLIEDPCLGAASRQEYGCGCFWFRRRGRPSAGATMEGPERLVSSETHDRRGTEA